MKAMILAAGRGERMRPLTDEMPKSLLMAGGKPLIVHLIESFARSDLRDIVINHAHLGGKIIDALGNGERYGVHIRYSQEDDPPLETGGGILKALPLLDSDPFLVINGDVWTDYPFGRLPRQLPGQAHLVLVDNPPHNPGGDFALNNGHVSAGGGSRLTFSGIGLYRHALFADSKAGPFPLAPLLRAAMERGVVTGEYYGGRWTDVGTPERLRALDRQLSRELKGKGPVD